MVCNTFQATILDQFNKEASNTYGNILRITGIPKKQLNAALIALCNPKTQVLKKAIKKPTFLDDAELITCNSAFKSEKLRLNMVPVQTREEKKESNKAGEEASVKAVIKERGMIIQAHLVKQMKTNKTMQFSQVIVKVKESIKIFNAKDNMIMDNIK